jgi:hypothetical protein
LEEQYFDSLLQKYGYSYSGNEKSQRDISYFFIRPDRMVEIHYNYPNYYLDVQFYKEYDITKLFAARHISLAHIMKDKDPNYNYLDYEAIMPGNITLERSLENLSELLKKYATTYLEGTEWKTWEDV